jgi:hypothetical protein
MISMAILGNKAVLGNWNTYSTAMGAVVEASGSSSLKVLTGASRRLAVLWSPLLILLTLLRAFMLGVEIYVYSFKR